MVGYTHSRIPHQWKTSLRRHETQLSRFLYPTPQRAPRNTPRESMEPPMTQPNYHHKQYTGYVYLVTKEQLENPGIGAELVIKAPLDQIEISEEIDLIDEKNHIRYISIKIFGNLLTQPATINLPFCRLASLEYHPLHKEKVSAKETNKRTP